MRRQQKQGLDAIPTADHCEGISFQYFVPAKSGRFRVARHDPLCQQVEELILNRLREVFQNRSDILEKIGCLPNGLEVRIYKTDGWTDDIKGKAKNATAKSRMTTGHFVGRTTYDGIQLTMEFAAKETLYGLENPHDGFEVIVHEFVHLLDFFTDAKGYFPDWNDSQRARFRKARKQELIKIKKGQSLLPDYALADHSEFLAVLAEVFFEQPRELQSANPELYALMREFFQLDP